MEVDLLRPGTVPIAADRLLWFEFLLDQTLLEKHLQKEKPDPSPTALIIQFLANSQPKETEAKIPEIQSENGFFKTEELPTKKSLALVLMALKIAAFLKWDLSVLGSKLPLKMQHMLMLSLVNITGRAADPYQFGCEMKLPDHVLFAVSLYHRWSLQAVRNCHMLSKPDRTVHALVPGQQDPAFVPSTVTEGILRYLESKAGESLTILKQIVEMRKVPVVPVFETFSMLREGIEKVNHCWDKGLHISSEEFTCQIQYDIGCFCFFKEDYAVAKQHIFKTMMLYNRLRKPREGWQYFSVGEAELKGYCAACGIKSTVTEITPLDMRFHITAHDDFHEILPILKQDNLYREIQMVYRDIFETDMEVLSRSSVVAKDILLHVKMLNIARRIVAREPVVQDYLTTLKTIGGKAVIILREALVLTMRAVTEEETAVKKFIMQLSQHDLIGFILFFRNHKFSKLFSDKEILTMTFRKKSVMLHGIGAQRRSWKGHEELWSGELQKILIESYEPREILRCLDELSSLHPQMSLLKINMRWDLPIPLQSVILNIPEGKLQDYCYIFMAKVRELMLMKSFYKAKALISAVEGKVKTSHKLLGSDTQKITQLIAWEGLLINIAHFFNEWPRAIGFFDLRSQSKDSLQTLLQSKDKIIPRSVVLEHAAVYLLCVSEWRFMMSLNVKSNYLELSCALAAICHGIVNHDVDKKYTKELWDMMTPLFLAAPPKRSNTGSTSAKRESPSNAVNRTAFCRFLESIHDPTILSVLISLFARFYNVLKDDANVDITLEQTFENLWPSIINNSAAHDLDVCGDYLRAILQHALELYPRNVNWLRIMGDLNYVCTYYAAAIKNYLVAGIVASDYFSQPLPKNVFDNQVYKRLVRCCMQLDYYIQAAVFCQFLEDIDYLLVWKCLQDRNCGDAMDNYYKYFWDVIILEFMINMHHKKGEVQKKQAALKAIGCLELNANNNEEIRREAANIRKSYFLRSMAKQFVVK